MHPALARLRVTARIVALTFRASLDYRGEFLVNVLFGAVYQTSVIVFASVVLGRFPGMGGWPAHAVLMIVALRMLSHALFWLFFGRIATLAEFVQEGNLDALLLRPLPVYRQVQLATFPSNAFGDLIVGVSLFVAAVLSFDVPWTPARILYTAAALAGGTLLEAAVYTTLSCLHFRFPAAVQWSYWTAELMSTFGNYPLKVLPRAVGWAFTFVLPLAFIAYLPTGVLTGNTAGLGVPAAVAAASPAVGVVAYLVSRLLWNRALRGYTGING
ncbi:ABC transporter permease [Kitasatospora terrestris]|uniref:ABC transporter permease n=2 Tax=Kitasatospora terrestris TaxID=258051 RepID=A0ABP9DFI3_9ACTN